MKNHKSKNRNRQARLHKRFAMKHRNKNRGRRKAVHLKHK